MTRFLAALSLALALAPALRAADWPQFLGPTRDNACPEPIPPWAGTTLKQLWKQPVGEVEMPKKRFLAENSLSVSTFHFTSPDFASQQARTPVLPKV